MKKILTFAFAAMAVFALQAADAYFRVDVDGQKEQIVLTPEKDSDYNAQQFGWLKSPDAKQYTLSVGFKKALSTAEWEDCEFSFIPSKSGTVNISIGGQWATKPENRAWLLVNKFEVNDKLYANGDFKKTWKQKNGRLIPQGFWLNGKSKYLPTAGEHGTPAVLVNHDNRLGFSLKVEAGKKYELEFEVKAATPELLK